MALLPLAIFLTSWVVMGEVIQGLLTGWPRPWLVTYCIKSGFALALLPYLALRRARLAAPGPPAPLPAPERTLLLAAAALSPISTACTIAWYISLPGTSFAGNAAVYQSATAFALLLSFLLLGEAVTLRKLACVAGALGGVALVAVGGAASGGRDTVAGYAWVIASTALYALYETLYARLTRAPPPLGGAGGGKALGAAEAVAEAEAAVPLLRRGASEADAGADAGAGAAAVPSAAAATPAGQSLLKAEAAALVLGGIGVATLLTQWPLFFVAHATGLERFEWPPPQGKARLVALNMGLDAIYNLSLLWGISTSSAFAMQLASTLVVPAGILADWVLHGVLPSALGAAGALLVLLAVAALEAPLEEAAGAACRRARAAAAAAACPRPTGSTPALTE
jgi:drug/metabolite transporter (DMT)-like permease